MESFSSEGLMRTIRALASDEFEGRLPGTRGEELTASYIEAEFKKLGLAPGNPDGTYVQKVPLVGIVSKPVAAFGKGGENFELKFPEDFVAVTRRVRPKVSVEASPVVFVGYGVVAPEYGWDDYKDVDVRGKTIVMLINDPPVPDPKDPSKLDPAMFKGEAMTYYGRWTYKYEIATKKGAAAALIIHEGGPAGYPYEVVVNSWGRENFDIQTPNGNAGRVPVEAWISSAAAARLLGSAGLSLAELKARALKKDFRPVELGLNADFTVTTSTRVVQSRNFVAKLEGSDPKLKDECVVYSAHWDHFGRDPKLPGRQIFSGALDNASGVAGVLELAKAFTKLENRPKRSLLFFLPTAEEQGLLGARYYAANPLYPLSRTLAVLNIDVLNPYGRTKDVVSVGYGYTTLDDLLVSAARGQGRSVTGDLDPGKGYFFRSDHFEFAKLGVPALDYGTGIDYIGRPKGWGKAKRDDYTAHHYHKVTDQVREDWDWSGGIEDLRLFLEVGWEVAQGSAWPEWKPGSEFHRP